MSKMKKTRKSGGGRKKLKPEYDAGKNLKEQMDAAVALYNSEMSLQAIGEELGLNPIKVRKLLITAGVYESEVAEKVQATFQEYRETQDYKTSILSTANTLKLSKASVTSYLPYRKGVYFTSTAEKGKISVGAERQRRYRAMKRWRDEPTEENPPKRVNRPEACGLRHLAFCVDSAEQTVNELAEVGIECEPIRVDDYTGKKMTFFHDPDGLPLELHE